MERETLNKLIREYQEKINRYQAMIDEWKKELGMAGEPILITPDSANVQMEGGESTITVKEWQFYGKSQPEAAKALLESTGHPLKTEDMLDALERGGVTIGGNSKQRKVTNLYTILHRNKDFAVVKRGSWGLVGWPGVKKRQDEEEPPESQENSET